MKARALATLVILLAIASGVALGTAFAERRSTAPPLTYSGVVFEGASPIPDGDHAIGLSLFPDASGGVAACTIAPAALATVAGHFSLRITDPACGTAIQQEEELYVALSVDGTVLPRARVGAVPYAVTAERVVLHSGDRPITTGVFCGESTPSTGRIRGDATTVGHAGAGIRCAETCSSPSAHMCSREEIERDWQSGRSDIPQGWINMGVPLQVSGLGTIDDCQGWTNNVRASYAYAAAPTAAPLETPYLTVQDCSVMLPILCCD